MIVCISGFIGSGKDTVAEYLIANHNFKKMSFAGSLKDAVASIFGWDRTMLEGSTTESREWRETVDSWWAERLKIPNITPRWVLQHWGTEVCRQHFHNEIWVASVENKLRQQTDNIVLTDCRFRNEVHAIKSAGGISMRVSRGPEPIWYKDAADYNRGPDGNSRWAIAKGVLDKHKVHASEYSSVGIKYDYNITNDSTLDELNAKVVEIISQQPSPLVSK